MREENEMMLESNPWMRGKLIFIERHPFKQFIEKVFDASGNRMFRIWTFARDGRTINVNYEQLGKRYDKIYRRVN